MKPLPAAHPLHGSLSVDRAPIDHLRAIGRVFATFDERTQDSGNRCYGVEIAAERLFVKTAGAPDDDRCYLPHRDRVGLLRNAVRLAGSVDDAALPALRAVVESAHGPMLVYDWVDGELLRAAPERRDDPTSPLQRLRRLPEPAVLACLDTIFDLHERLAAAGWVAADFYDGSLLYDFDADRLHVVDLDNYHAGPFRNSMGRLFGSERFMAPEEFELGALIDQRTTVFTLGRTARVLWEPARAAGAAEHELLGVIGRACAPAPAERYPHVAEFAQAWRAARAR